LGIIVTILQLPAIITTSIVIIIFQLAIEQLVDLKQLYNWLLRNCYWVVIIKDVSGVGMYYDND
jgi:hypothetical protein